MINITTYAWMKKYVDKVTAGATSITPGGEWSAELSYKKGTIVSKSNNLYIAILDVPAGTEILNTAYWSLLLENTDINDIFDLENASYGQIPYMGNDGKIIWNNIALRRDNDYNYKKIENTFVPSNGEVCLIDVAGYGLRMKVGDGTSVLAQLPYTDETILNNIYSLIVKGYLYQNEFYSDIEHTKPLEKIIGRIYIEAINGKLYTFNGTNYETQTGSIPNATATVSGTVKLYDQIGQNTDGTMTQKAITDELNDKIEMSFVKEEEMIIFDTDI